MDSKWLKEISEDEEIKELAWKHVDLCENCGSCSGGTRKVILEKSLKKFVDVLLELTILIQRI